MSQIDPDKLRLDPHYRKPAATDPDRPPPLLKRGGRFLKGPVPLAWVQAAAQSPGKSLHVGIVLWFLAGLKKRHTVKLSNRLLRDFGVDRNAKYRALAWLEEAKLIHVARHLGRSPRVTIKALPNDEKTRCHD